MKKSKIIKRLKKAAGTYKICRCYFNHIDDYFYFYILDYSDKLMLGIEEDDFILDGFEIRKVKQINRIEFRDDACVKINKERLILADVVTPVIDLTSWKTVFKSLSAMGCFVRIDNDNAKNGNKFTYIGIISKVKKLKVVFTPVDADGVWLDDIDIPYSKITSLTFGDRYSKTWQEYLSNV